jgi:hypothetical protein
MDVKILHPIFPLIIICLDREKREKEGLDVRKQPAGAILFRHRLAYFSFSPFASLHPKLRILGDA